MNTAPQPIRAVIVDDEELARRRMRRLLSREPDVEVLAECATGVNAVAAIRRHTPDVVFLDIRMPGMDGFGVVQQLGADPAATLPLVVFVTAYDDHALRAFDVHATDYILKPIDPDRFRVAVTRVRHRLAHEDHDRRQKQLLALLSRLERLPTPSPAGASPPAASSTERFMVRSGGRMFFVKVADIDWIEARGNYVRLHVGKQHHLVRETMTRLERSLNPGQFARIHRSTIVNLDRVREMQPWFWGDWAVLLQDGTRLRMSRWYRSRLESRTQL